MSWSAVNTNTLTLAVNLGVFFSDAKEPMKEVERVGYSHDAATKYSTARTYGNLHSRVRTASQFHHSRVFLYCPNPIQTLNLNLLRGYLC